MFLEVPGAKIFATRSGPRDGAVILAIGGWIGSSELWMEPLAQLSDSYVTIAYDHRGSGLTVCDCGPGRAWHSSVRSGGGVRRGADSHRRRSALSSPRLAHGGG
jgi:pimeloyl-ACP methyl ester carboxylesterase